MDSNTNHTDPKKPFQKDRPLLHKDFVLVVIGQVISLFGNAILRFALPLYILSVSGSPALFGLVSALSFIPMIVMSPLGGIVADRVHKQRIMVVLDFFTSALIVTFILLRNSVPVIPLVVIMMMALAGISGAYSPSVQASMPLLAREDNLVQANAIVNLVSSFSGFLGPVIGGVLFSAYGLLPILVSSAVCFFLSAVMELFIRIPHRKLAKARNVREILKGDMAQSFRFILKEKPILAKGTVVVCCLNLFLGSMVVIGLPVLITQYLGLSDKYYGIAMGLLGAGGLIGGLLAGILGNKLNIRRAYLLILVCAGGLFPIALALLLGAPAMVSYSIITIMCFLLMIFATIFSVQVMTFAQSVTPIDITGKVISYILALSLCAQPVGQAFYGLLFETLPTLPWAVVLGTALVSAGITLYSKKIFNTI